MKSDQTETLPNEATCVVSLSGGMDSTGLLMHLLAKKCRVYGISFDYGQKHRLELERLDANLKYLAEHGYQVDHRIVDISSVGSLFHSALIDETWDVPEGFYEQQNMKETVVPNRNAIFSSIAYGYALSIALRDDCRVSLSLGVHSGDHAIYPDCRPEFYDSIFNSFAIGNWDADRVSLYLPYLDGDKISILQDAEKAIESLGLDFEQVFRNTITSYAPDDQGRSHGRTGSDVERILAFHALGKIDPVEYVDGWDSALSAALEFESRHQ